MKKIKLMSVILCCIILFGISACSTADTSPTFDELPPWSQQGNACTETAEYDFARYLDVDNPDPQYVLDGEDISKGYKLNSLGHLTYTIKEGVSLQRSGDSWSETAKSNHTLIKMEMTVTYKDNLDHTTQKIIDLYAGKTDYVISYTVLDRYTLNSLFTYKKTEIQTQLTLGDDKLDTKDYTLTADYTGEFTGVRQATVTDKTGTAAVSIKAGDYFDSESIYHQVRAMRSVDLEGGGTRAFSIAMPYNDALEGEKKLKAKSAKQTTAADKAGIKLAPALRGIFALSDEQAAGTGEFVLDCYQTALALTTKKPGPDIILYYSAYPIRTNNKDGRLVAANKVLVKIAYPNHDKYTNSVYQQEYTLKSYSNSN